jgi:hypothetical protein
MRTVQRGFLAIVGLAAAAVVVSAQGRTQHIYVSATDKAGLPVRSLTAADFTIKEDGRDREVLGLAPATAPLQVALLIDNSQSTMGMVAELRQGMANFVAAMLKANPQTTISLATFGDRPTPVEGFTSAAPPLIRAVQRTFPVSGSGAYFTDAVIDASKALKKEGGPRPVVVAFVNEAGEEFSNSSRRQAIEALQNAGAQMWVVVMQGTGSLPMTQEARDRAALVGDTTNDSGGTSLQLLNRISFPDKMVELAGLLNTQLEVTYGRPEQLIPASKLDVKVAAKDVKLRAPRWATK